MADSPFGVALLSDSATDLQSTLKTRQKAFLNLVINPSPEAIQNFLDATKNLINTTNGLAGMLPANYTKILPAQNAEFQSILDQHGLQVDIKTLLQFFETDQPNILEIIKFLQALPAKEVFELELSTLTTPQKIIAYLQYKVANSDFAQLLKEIKDRKPELYDQITKGKIAELLKQNEKYFGAEKTSMREKAKQWFAEKILRKAA